MPLECRLSAVTFDKGLKCLKYFVWEKVIKVDIQNCAKETPLMKALFNNYEQMVKWLLEQKANVNEAEESGKTCLHYAVQHGSLRCVEMILDAGATINAQNNEGWTALYYAPMEEHSHVVNHLLRKSANFPLQITETSLHTACANDDLRQVKLLLDRLPIDIRDNIFNTPLHKAAACGSSKEVVAFLLVKGANPKLKNLYGRTCLHHAAENVDLEYVELILNAGATINAQDNVGRTALYCASLKGHANVVKYLLGKSANPHLAHTQSESTCLHVACKKNHLECVKLILDHLPIDCKDKNGDTPLHNAAYWGSKEVATFLLERQAYPNLKNSGDEETSLHYAIRREHFEIAKLLVENNADVNATNKFGKTCLQNAAERADLQFVELILNAGAEVNAKDNECQTALDYASCKGHANVVKYLLGKSANPHLAHTQTGITCLHIACKYNNLECVKLLQEHLSIECRTKNGNTPLLTAAYWGSKLVAIFLLESGADIYVKNFADEETSLHFAIRREHFEIAKLLVEKNADVNAADKNGNTCLHRAAERADLQYVELILNAGAEIDSQDNLSRTALYYATLGGHANVVKYLLGKSVNPQLADTQNGNTYLHVACQKNYIECVKLLLEHLPIDCRDTNGDTPLHYAAYWGSQEVAKFLLEGQAKPNLKNCFDEETSLHYAIRREHFEIVRLLVEKKADVNAADKNGKTCLHRAAEMADLQYVELILNEVVDIDAQDNESLTSLCYASLQGNANVVKYLLGNKANPYLAHRQTGYTCLHAACQKNQMECVKMILDHLQIDCKDRNGDTPLHYAAFWGSKEVAIFLLERGADPNLKNSVDEETSLHYAIRMDQFDIVKLLVEENADVNAADKNGTTCLHNAAEKADLKYVELILNAGAEIDAQNVEGRTALYCASLKGHENVVKYLLGKSANPHLAHRKTGFTCLHIACKKNHIDCVKLLLVHLPIDCTDNKGDTPLHKASFWGSKEVAAFLLEGQANPNIKNCADKETSLHYAIRREHFDIVELLVEKNADVNAADKRGKTCLHHASRKVDLDYVHLILNAGADINAHDNLGCTALYYATLEGHAHVVKYLLGKSANLRLAHEKTGSTCLHVACRKNHLECVKLLLDHLPIDCLDKNGDTPLHEAAFWGSKELAIFLLERRADSTVKNCADEETSLHYAIRREHFDIVELIVEKNAVVKAADTNGITCLHLAAERADLQYVELILNAEAEINAQDNEGLTALYYASIQGHANVVKYLLGKSANPLLAHTQTAYTCLHVACQKNYQECVTLLLEHLPIDCRDKDGNTPLHEASLWGSKEVATFLLERGADPNLKNNVDQETSLHCAIRSEHFEIVNMLVEKNADVNAVDKNSCTCLQHAAKIEDLRYVELILNAGAKIDAKYDAGESPFAIAELYGNTSVLNYLRGYLTH